MVAYNLYLKWPEVATAEAMTTNVAITVLEGWFLGWVLPLEIITKNGP